MQNTDLYIDPQGRLVAVVLWEDSITLFVISGLKDIDNDTSFTCNEVNI